MSYEVSLGLGQLAYRIVWVELTVFSLLTTAIVYWGPGSAEAAAKYTEENPNPLHLIMAATAFFVSTVTGLVRYCLEVDHLKQRLVIASVLKSVIALMAHIVMMHAAEFRLVVIDRAGKVFLFYRCIQWMFTMPVMLFDICILADEPTSTFLTLSALNATVLVCGMLGRLNILDSFGFIFWVVAFAVFVKEMFLVNKCFFRIRAKAAVQFVKVINTSGQRGMLFCHFYTMILWFTFPVADMLCMSGAISSSVGETLWCFLDYFAKSVFSTMINVATSVSVDAAEKVANSAIMEARSRQLTQLCHEIRNPLNGILGNVEFLSDQSDEPEFQETVSTVQLCCSHLRRTLDDILSIDMIGLGKLRLMVAPFRPAHVLADVLSQVQLAIKEKNLQVHVEVDPMLRGRGVVLLADAYRIKQIVANYAWNAIKFTTKGSITLRCACESLGPSSTMNRMRVRFEVEDTGAGIDDRQQALLFEPFEMGSESRISKYGGSGLGLNICKALAKLQGGEVGCSSRLGYGSTFWYSVDLDTGLDEELSDDSDADLDMAPSAPPGRDIIMPRRNSANMAQSGGGGMQRASSGAVRRGANADWFVASAGQVSRNQVSNPRRSGDTVQGSSSAGELAAQTALLDIRRRLDNVPFEVEVVREIIFEHEVSCLVCVRSPSSGSRQVWGFALRKQGQAVSDTLNLAIADALNRVAALFPLASSGNAAAPRSRGTSPTGGSSGDNRSPRGRSPEGGHPSQAAERLALTADHPALEAIAGSTASARSSASAAADGAAGDGGGAKKDGEGRLQMRGSYGGFSRISMGVGGDRDTAISARPTDTEAPTSWLSDGASPSRPGGGAGAPQMRQSTSSHELLPDPHHTATRIMRGSSGNEATSIVRVLVVDDEPVNVKLVQRALLRGGVLEAVGADDGSSALELLIDKGERFDMILMDEHMRTMNGSVAIEALRAHEAKHSLLPTCVIVTTGNASEADMQRFATAGADGIQSKPLSLKTLVADLKETMRARRRAADLLDFSAEGCMAACARLAEGNQPRYGEIIVWAWAGTAGRPKRTT